MSELKFDAHGRGGGGKRKSKFVIYENAIAGVDLNLINTGDKATRQENFQQVSRVVESGTKKKKAEKPEEPTLIEPIDPFPF